MFRANYKAAPININKVSSSLISFGRKLIGPAIPTGGAMSTMTSPPNTNISPSVGRATFSEVLPSLEEPTSHHSAPPPPLQMPQNQRMMKSESMPVHLSKGTCLVQNYINIEDLAIIVDLKQILKRLKHRAEPNQNWRFCMFLVFFYRFFFLI